MRLIGSLELLGSPGTLAGSVGTGLRDFVLYPYQGIFQGPTGFISGLGNGVTSLLKSITSGKKIDDGFKLSEWICKLLVG
jgi:vacuolar protein sorting-associated protein 13B